MKIWAFIIVGISSGMIFARYQLCFASAVRNFIAFRRKEKLILFLILVVASSVLINFFIGVGLLEETVKALMPMTFLGGIFFGIGMVIAGGDAAGILFRAGEGNLPALACTVGMVAGMALFGFTVAAHFTEQLPHFVAKTILNQFNINPLIFSFIAAALGIIASIYMWRKTS
ncbi:MAG: YeeE/YedE family protein [Desulfobacteraceae bacterium]|nr:YeeE/YedE family protein [Desulfobacteraceae bacterium]